MFDMSRYLGTAEYHAKIAAKFECEVKKTNCDVLPPPAAPRFGSVSLPNLRSAQVPSIWTNVDLLLFPLGTVVFKARAV